MPKSSIRNKIPKTEEELRAEKEGQQALRTWLKAETGRQARICKSSGILPAVMSRMANKDTHINLEAAILIEVASEGALPAEVLCPSRAEALKTMMRQRARRV